MSPRPPERSRIGLREVLAHWGIEGRARRIARGSNGWHWRINGDGGPLVLRRYNPWRAIESIPFEHAFLTHLASRQWPVAVPLEDLSGATLFARDGEAYAIFPFLPGRPRTDTAAAARERGALLARCHADSRAFPDREQRPSWTFAARLAERAWPPDGLVLGQVLARLAPIAPDIVTRVRTHAAFLTEALAEGPDLAPVVAHGDWSGWNLLFAAGTLTGALDFDFCHWDSPLADLAIAVRNSRPGGGWPVALGARRHPGHADALLAGYTSIEPLSDEARRRIPIYSMRFALGRIIQRLSFGLTGRTDVFEDASRSLDLLDAERRALST